MAKQKMNRSLRQCWGLERKSFPHGYIKWFVLLLGVSVLAPMVVYLCFAGKGFIQPGIGLDKSHWLYFFSAYIPSLATAFLGLSTVTLTHHLAQQEDSRRAKSIQPVFSVEIVKTDSRSKGLYKTTQGEFVDFEGAFNTYIAIKNIGNHPITNIRILDGRRSFLLPGETIHVCCKYGEGIPDLIECDFEKPYNYKMHKEAGDSFAPKTLDIYYTDIDGSDMHQKFALRHQSHEPVYKGHYGLRRVERISYGPEIKSYDIYETMREQVESSS